MTIARTRIRREVEALARREAGWTAELRDAHRLVEDLRLDSIRLLSLAVAVEDRFRIRLDEDDEAAIRTVGDLVAVIERKLGGGGPPDEEPPPAPGGGGP